MITVPVSCGRKRLISDANDGLATAVAETADGIFRINTPVDVLGGFSLNQYLVVNDEPPPYVRPVLNA